MAYSDVRSDCVRRAGRAVFAATALLIALAVGAGSAAAQQPKKGPEKAPAPAAQKQDKGGQPAQAGEQSAWVKLCDKAAMVVKDKDGKDSKKEMNVCLTHHERIDGNTGMILVSAAVRQIEGQEKQMFMAMVPLGMILPAGMRAAIYPKEQWEQLQKQEKIDESKLKVVQLNYVLCHPGGCTAELEATPELLNLLKTAGGVTFFTINAAGAPVAFPVPLTGFAQAYAGPPADTKKYAEARKRLAQQIAERQHQLAEEYKKQQEQLNKMEGPEAHQPPPSQPAASPKTPPAKK
jgi:invasion protein IalB